MKKLPKGWYVNTFVDRTLYYHAKSGVYFDPETLKAYRLNGLSLVQDNSLVIPVVASFLSQKEATMATKDNAVSFRGTVCPFNSYKWEDTDVEIVLDSLEEAIENLPVTEKQLSLL